MMPLRRNPDGTGLSGRSALSLGLPIGAPQRGGGAPLGIRPRTRAHATAATTLRIPRRGRLHSLRSRSPAPPGAVAMLLASPCFAHLVPETLPRDHAGLIQRFPSVFPHQGELW